MASSQHTNAFNLDLGNLLGGSIISNIIGDLTGGNSILGAFDLGNIFDSLLGSNNIFDNIGLGDIFGDLGVNNLFGSVNLNDIFKNLSGLNLDSNSSIDGLLSDLGGLFGKLDLGDLFGGMEDNYFYIFDQLPVNDLVSGLGQVSGLTSGLTGSGKALDSKVLNVKNVDLLDGFGTMLNLLGKNDALKDFSIEDILTGDLKGNLLKGISGDDLLLGRKGNDRLFASKGDDLINGGDGNDYEEGDSGNDVLVGMTGNDALLGGKGNDIIAGGTGNNTATGGKGDDQFLLQPKGKLVISDFNSNHDKLVTLGKIGFGDLTISQQGNNAIVSFGGRQLATLQGINAGQITEKVFSTLVS